MLEKSVFKHDFDFVYMYLIYQWKMHDTNAWVEIIFMT